MSGKQDIRATVKHQPQVIDKYRDWEKQVSDRQRERHPEIDPAFIHASFFPRDKVPEVQRSKQIIVRGDNGHKGELMAAGWTKAEAQQEWRDAQDDCESEP